MRSLAIYSLLSHTCAALPYQREMLARFAPPHRFVVVQGPFGTNQRTAGGNLALAEPGIETLTLGESGIAGRFWGQRIPAVLESVLEYARTQAEELVLILHGDLLPLWPIASDFLLGERPLAGRGNPASGRLGTTWLLVDVPRLGATPLREAASSANIFVAQAVTCENAAALLGFVPAGYEDHWHFEYCGPGWLHLDRQSAASESMPAKLAAIRGPLGLDPQPLACESIAAPFHPAMGGSIVAQKLSTTGDQLHALIKHLTGQDFTPTCSCRAMVEKMNAHPPEWTLENIKMIANSIRTEVRNRSWWGKAVAALPGIGAPVKYLIRESVRRAQAEAAQEKP